MSKNIIIQEGGVGKQLTVDKIKTDLVSGGTCLWVPEDEVQLTTKSITADGTYNASDDGAYGYSQVSVHGIGRVTGKDPQTGEEKTITTDPNTGEIVEEVVPVEIRITTMPAKVEYQDGETIDMTGAIIKAYSANGAEMQTVPIGEVSLQPLVAVYDSKTAIGTSTLDDLTVEYGSLPLKRQRMNEKTGIAFTPHILSQISGGQIKCIRLTNGRAYYLSRDNTNDNVADENGQHMGTQVLAFSDESISVYYNSAPGTTERIPPYIDIVSPEYPITEYSLSTAAKVLFKGQDTGYRSRQTITVSWPRPGDGAVLETSFNINVTGGE